MTNTTGLKIESHYMSKIIDSPLIDYSGSIVVTWEFGWVNVVPQELFLNEVFYSNFSDQFNFLC
jgi:hypothetical protein